MLNLRLYMLQRITALVMVPFVVIHIAVMIYAVQGGLSATEILGRTQGSIWWIVFYGTFVIAVSIHATISLRVIVSEMTRLEGKILDVTSWIALALLMVLGLRAVFAVTI